jgi:hypothetical protein
MQPNRELVSARVYAGLWSAEFDQQHFKETGNQTFVQLIVSPRPHHAY